MTAGRPEPVDLNAAYDALTFVGDRTVDSTDAELGPAFAEIAHGDFGPITIGHYAGDSEWERHRQGDEYVAVIDGETEMTFPRT